MLSVTQLNKYLGYNLSRDAKLKGVAVKGEISDFSFSYSGHAYFSVKDEQAALRAVMFSSNAEGLKFMPENGMEVILIGNVSYYQRSGTLQIVCTDMAQVGAGRQNASLEALRARLSAMGIFDNARKKDTPERPERIGVVTSENGAALQDILNVIGRRCRLAEVVVFHASVQGENSASEICRALKRADSSCCDVIILARGGGSDDDLMTFNKEEVVMAVADCKTPVISAVGHETDTTLADYAADKRAPTPSAAAELAVSEDVDLSSELQSLERRISLAAATVLQNKTYQKDIAVRRLFSASPQRKLSGCIHRLDEMALAFETSVLRIAEKKRAELSSVYGRLEALNPFAVLTRGYAIVLPRDGKELSQAEKGDIVDITVSGGRMSAELISVERTDGDV